MIMLKDKALLMALGLMLFLPLGIQASTPAIPNLLNHDVILLGERHDHPDHHINQAAWLHQIAKDGTVNLVMEMVSVAQMDRIEERPTNSDAWREALNWDESGWPDFEIYRPLFDVISQHELMILPGVMSVEPGTSFDQRLSQMRIAAGNPPKIPDSISSSMAEDVRVGHCDLLPEEMIAPMVEIQWLKDAFMAKQLRDGLAKSKRSVLIAGNGHTQGDSGVPVHLADLEASLLAVVQQEGNQGGYGGDEDTIIITREIPMDDPCKSLRERFGKKKG